MDVPLLFEHGGQISVIGRMEQVGQRLILSARTDPVDPVLRAVSLVVTCSDMPDGVIEKALRDSFTFDGKRVGERRSTVVSVERREPLWLVAVYSENIID